MASPLHEIETVLRTLMSPVDNARRQAEEHMERKIKVAPDTLIVGLVRSVRESEQVSVRAMSAVLLRRYLLGKSYGMWGKANVQTRGNLKAALLDALSKEKVRTVWTKLCDTVADVAIVALGESEQWPQLFPFLMQCVRGTPQQCEAALRVLTPLSFHIVENMKGDLVSFKAMLAKCTQHASSNVRAAAVKALSQLVVYLKLEKERAAFADVTPVILTTIANLIRANETSHAADALDAVIDLADSEFVLVGLAPHLGMIVQLCTGVLRAKNLDDRLRHLSVELLVSLAERAPSAVRRMTPANIFLAQSLPALLQLMTELEDKDDVEWSKSRDEDDMQHDNSHLGVGMQAFLRLGTAIRTKKFAPVALTLIEQTLSRSTTSADWAVPHAALMALSQISEVLPEDPSKHVALLQHKIAPFFDHPQPRVRYAALHCLGTFSQDLGPTLQAVAHGFVIPKLVASMEREVPHPRVQAHAVEVLSTFIDMCKNSALLPYLKNLLERLAQMLQRSPMQVQEKVVAAVASIADRAGEHFVPYYDHFVPSLKAVFLRASRQATGTSGAGRSQHEQEMLSGRCLECITLIGIAVGKNKFKCDALHIMQELVRRKDLLLAVTSAKSVGPLASFMLAAWGRIGKCLGADFAAFLPHVVPHLLQVAHKTPGQFVSDEELKQKQDESGVVCLAGEDGRHLLIRTSALEDKALAVRMLACFAADLGAAFEPFVGDTMHVLGPLAKESYFDDIRLASLASMPSLLKIARFNAKTDVTRKRLADLFMYALTQITSGLQQDMTHSTEEVIVEVTLTAIQSLQACLLSVGAKRGKGASASMCPALELPTDMGTVVLQLLHMLLRASMQRRAVSIAEQKCHDMDEDEIEMMAESAAVEDELRFQIADAMGTVFRVFGTRALPAANVHVIPQVLDMSDPRCAVSDRKLALFIVDDLFEHCIRGGGGPELLSRLFPVVLKGLEACGALSTLKDDSDVPQNVPGLVQAAAYGVGVAARFGGAHFAQHEALGLRGLVAVIQSKTARHPAVLPATDNAVAALGHVLEQSRSSSNRVQLWGLWLASLPLTGDLDESRKVLDQLLRLVQTNHAPLLMDETGKSRLGHILIVFVRTFLVPELVHSDELRSRLIAAVRHIRGAIPNAATIRTIVSSLGQEERKVWAAIAQ